MQAKSGKLRIFAANCGLSREETLAASHQLGRLSLVEFENTKVYAPLHLSPKRFDELLLDGIALQASKNLSVADIKIYCQRLLAAEMTLALPWMTPWLRSTYFYRGQRYSEAYPHAMDAYEKAQYCAGARQCLLLNQYVELAAKNNKWKEFRKAVLWAEYLGIEVGGLNAPASNKENLKAMFEVMKTIHCHA